MRIAAVTDTGLQRRDDRIRRLLEFRGIGRIRQEMDFGKFEPPERFVVDIAAGPNVELHDFRDEQPIRRLPFIQNDRARFELIRRLPLARCICRA